MGSASPSNVLWDLLLAAIPVLLGYGLYWCSGGMNGPPRLPLPLCWLLGLAWLAFLPNSCYLLTEGRHLLVDEQWASLRETAGSDRSAMLRLALWAGFFFTLSMLGVLCFTLAIRPVERLLRRLGWRPVFYAPFLFLAVSLGVYLGLIVRLNSWDLATRPLHVLEAIMGAVNNPTALAAMAVFALLLWALYEALDLWLDAFLDRVRDWGYPQGRGAGAPGG